MSRFAFVLILIGYLIVGSLFAIYTPAWQAPDEPAHYNYIAQVARGGCCPTIQMGDWDSAYLDALKGADFAPDMLGNLATVQYEDHQPPLYYLLAAPIFNLTNGNLTALRLYSVAIGTIIVLCTYVVARILLPTRVWVALSAAAFVAFLPQNVAILASVNNDALGWALIAVTLVAVVWYLVNPQENLNANAQSSQKTYKIARWTLSENQFIVLMAVLVGLIFVTKATGYLMAGVVVLAIYLRHRSKLPLDPLRGLRGPTAMLRDMLAQVPRTNPFVSITNIFEGLTLAVPYWVKRQFRQPLPLLKAWALFVIPAVLIGCLWWVRNFGVYGVPDFLGLRAHDRVVVGQPRTASYIAQFGEVKYWSDLAQTTFTSFWGQFGWMALPLNGWLLWVAQGLTLLAVSGWAVRVFLKPQEAALGTTGNKEAEKTPESQDQGRRSAWIALTVMGLLAVAAYAYYNSEFLQFQARYMYAGLIPFALAFALGLEAWAALVVKLAKFEGNRAQTVYWLVTVVPVVMLAPFCVYLLWKVIVPNLVP